MAPLYDFACDHCGKSFESLMKPHDPVVCPHCGTYEKATRTVTASACYIRGAGDWSTSQKPNKDQSTEK